VGYPCLGGLVFLLAASCCGIGQAAAEEGIRVEVPEECTAESRAATADYPFIERLGDARFAPRPLKTTEDTINLVQPDLDLPVSAAPMADHETLLIANYHNVLSLNIRSGKATTLNADLGKLSNHKYVPTGIALGQRTGRVFLANYLANNILIGHIDVDRIVFDQALAGDGLVSPENVAVTADESWVVSANFDGSSATAFALAGDRYGQKWVTQIPSAHGVAILGDMVFVSSLISRKIIVLNLSDGHEIGSFGQPGWNASCLDFLWPTGIQAGEDGVIVIADAHTGGIYRISFDGRVGKVLDVIGGTAPGPAGLQMPYSAASIGSDLAILSTFSPKVLIIGAAQPGATPAIKAMIVQQARQAEPNADREQPLPLGVGWNGYVHLASARNEVSGFLTVPSYGALMRVTQGQTLRTAGPLSLVPDTLRLFRWLMYFVEASPTENGVVLSSPSAPFALYLTRGQTSCFLKIDLPGAPLATKSGLEHRFGITRYVDIERQALARLHELDLRRGPDAFLPLSAIAEFLDLPLDSIRETIKTSEGTDALAALAHCNEQQCGKEQHEAPISRYKSELASRLEAPLLELLLLDMSVHRCAA
jgi:hypothetical protein